MKTQAAGKNLIKSFEALRLTAYFCPAGVPTIGWGTIDGVTAEDVRSKRTITEAEAESMFLADLRRFEFVVESACKVTPTQNQFDAMVSLAYNIGAEAFRKSSVLRAHNRGDFAAAARAFALWNKARVKGKLVELRGLVIRRAAEAALYLKPARGAAPVALAALPVEDVPDEDLMPQRVEPESNMTSSTINRASVATGGVATLAAVAEVADTAAQVKYSVDSLGQWVVPILLVAVVALAGYVVWQRIKQRQGGWA
jgi:lysozyme